MWAGFVPAMGIIEHVGRKSGRKFRTPVNVFPTDEGLAVLLTYGPNRDWLKNLAAANGGRIKHYGKSVSYTDPQVVPKARAAELVNGLWRPIFARLPFEQAVLLKRV
jgi:deazaflavin-dependent oxidoreductase (nitroreductase family)